jgi:hypothetical protein
MFGLLSSIAMKKDTRPELFSFLVSLPPFNILLFPESILPESLTALLILSFLDLEFFRAF